MSSAQTTVRIFIPLIPQNPSKRQSSGSAHGAQRCVLRNQVRITCASGTHRRTRGLYLSWHNSCFGASTMYQGEHKSKLMSPEAAVRLIPRRGTLSMGMAISEPPALLQALEGRIQTGDIEELRLYYSHSAPAAMTTILKYEYLNVVKPHPFFPRLSSGNWRGEDSKRTAVCCSTCRETSARCHGFWPTSESTLSW
jgi:hypothetical protein